jgi:hypothetical protein
MVGAAILSKGSRGIHVHYLDGGHGIESSKNNMSDQSLERAIA